MVDRLLGGVEGGLAAAEIGEHRSQIVEGAGEQRGQARIAGGGVSELVPDDLQDLGRVLAEHEAVLGESVGEQSSDDRAGSLPHALARTSGRGRGSGG